MIPREMNVLAISHGNSGERYVFLWDDDGESLEMLLNIFGQYAADPSLGFSWRDATLLAQKVREKSELPAARRMPF